MEGYIIWAIIIAACLIIEFCTFAYVSIWFASGATLTLGLSFIPGLAIWMQIIIFMAVSLLLFFATRRFVLTFLNQKKVPTNADSLIGKQTEIIVGSNEEGGPAVKISGLEWSVKCGDKLSKGDKVEIKEISGSKLTVEKIA